MSKRKERERKARKEGRNSFEVLKEFSSCGMVSLKPHKNFLLNLIHKKTFLAYFINFL